MLINATQASRVLQCGPQRVRERMKDGSWPIGDVVKKGTKTTYEVHVHKMAKFFGIPVEVIENGIK